MKPCPYCAEPIQDDAVKCRYCGEWLDESQRPAASGAYCGPRGYVWNYEYRSKTEVWGWPLVHIAQGIDRRAARRPLMDRRHPSAPKDTFAPFSHSRGVPAHGPTETGELTRGPTYATLGLDF